jgi:hypothetical protein
LLAPQVHCVMAGLLGAGAHLLAAGEAGAGVVVVAAGAMPSRAALRIWTMTWTRTSRPRCRSEKRMRIPPM